MVSGTFDGVYSLIFQVLASAMQNNYWESTCLGLKRGSRGYPDTTKSWPKNSPRRGGENRQEAV